MGFGTSAGRCVRGACLGLALLRLGTGAAQAQVVTEFSAGISAFGLESITAGPDGNVWFTEQNGDRIGRVTPLGVITEFSSGISDGAGPFEITAGPEGNLWFTEGLGRIGRITPLGVVTEFSVGISANALPHGITTGLDGNLWFTESGLDRIGRITPLGAVTEFSAGISANAGLGDITSGPDGNLWFTERAGRIGRITPSGVVTEFPAGLSPFTTNSIAAGPDGNLWFTESEGDYGAYGRVARITPLGVVTEFPVSVASYGITAGPDGNVWFAESMITGPFVGPEFEAIGRITPLGVVTEFLAGFIFQSYFGSQPYAITSGPDGNLWFTDYLANVIGRITTASPKATSFHTTSPCRVLDTRNAAGPLGGPALAAGARRDLVVAGACGIPAEAVSISANVTVTDPSTAGTLLTLPAQLPVVAFQAGATRANNALLLLPADGSGTLSFSNDLSSGTVQVIVDVNGWWQ